MFDILVQLSVEPNRSCLWRWSKYICVFMHLAVQNTVKKHFSHLQLLWTQLIWTRQGRAPGVTAGGDRQGFMRCELGTDGPFEITQSSLNYVFDLCLQTGPSSL